jgi:hypothetical protein
MGQLSEAPGRQATQRFVPTSQRGVAPPHCASDVHCTHCPPALHTCPDGHGWLGLQPGTHAFCWHTWPRGHWGSITHATHEFVAGLHTGAPGVVQSPLPTQPTQVLVAGLHTGRPGVVHCAFEVHCTQRPWLASHNRPEGHTGCCAEQPGTQTSLRQRRPGPQCVSWVHSTQAPPGLQYCPSSHAPRSSRQPGPQMPATQVWPTPQWSSLTHSTHSKSSGEQWVRPSSTQSAEA